MASGALLVHARTRTSASTAPRIPPFVEGRMRLSRDGSLLFVTMGNNVVAYPTGG